MNHVNATIFIVMRNGKTTCKNEISSFQSIYKQTYFEMPYFYLNLNIKIPCHAKGPEFDIPFTKGKNLLRKTRVTHTGPDQFRTFVTWVGDSPLQLTLPSSETRKHTHFSTGYLVEQEIFFRATVLTALKCKFSKFQNNNNQHSTCFRLTEKPFENTEHQKKDFSTLLTPMRRTFHQKNYSKFICL